MQKTQHIVISHHNTGTFIKWSFLPLQLEFHSFGLTFRADFGQTGSPKRGGGGGCCWILMSAVFHSIQVS